jgi:histidine triad (HIT) family protein
MCIFCKIVSKEIPNKTILEDDDFLAFEDINKQAKIHVLIIPKQHIESFNDVSPQMMVKMTDFIHKVVDALGIRDDGYRLITNIGKNGNQEVKHLHFHILAGEMIGKLRCD